MVLNRQLETTMVMFNSYVILHRKTTVEVDSYVSPGKKITRYGDLTSRVQNHRLCLAGQLSEKFIAS